MKYADIYRIMIKETLTERGCGVTFDRTDGETALVMMISDDQMRNSRGSVESDVQKVKILFYTRLFLQAREGDIEAFMKPQQRFNLRLCHYLFLYTQGSRGCGAVMLVSRADP